MKQTQLIMGMPVSVEIVDYSDTKIFKKVFDYFKSVDEKFSTYKKTSEVSQINSGKISDQDFSLEMQEILTLAQKTKKETDGFFDIYHDGKMDPSGIVKGWAIWEAAKLLDGEDVKNYYVDAGGDIQTKGSRINNQFSKWKVGIKNPFKQSEIVKVVELSGEGIATSGTYIRGEHIYNPKNNNAAAKEIASMTVIAENVYEADRFATAAFAMGREGINFVERQKGLEGYMIDLQGIATYTSGFETFIS